MTDDRGVRAQPPEEDLDAIRVGAPADVAAGLPGITVSLRYARDEMGTARAVRTLRRVNQKGGFDCQSCAWPDPDGPRHVAEFCENGAKAVAWEATTRRATPEVLARYTVSELSDHSDHWLGELGRLTEPMLLREGADRYERVSWDDAFAIVAGELHALASPDEAAFYTSGRTSNEAAFLWQLFARQFGTNNLPDCSNMCHESSGAALGETIGVGKGTVTLEDFARADAIFIVGQNPGTNHPRMLATLEQAKRRGATIVAINPLVETGLKRFKHPQDVRDLLGRGTPLADFHLRVRVGGDVAVLQGIGKAVLDRGAIDQAFVAEHTHGFDAYVEAIRDTPWDAIVEAGGVPRGDIERAADVFARSRRTITCWGMGLTQHVHAVANIQEIVNLHLLRGQIGVPGAGLCPVRGHSNVQGDRTVGITAWPRAAFLDALGREFGFTPPRSAGLDTVDTIHAMHAGRVKVLVAMGGNFLQATPDTEYVAQALRRCRLTVHVATKPNRAHLVAGRRALLLPCLGRSERDGDRFVSTENSMGVVQMSRGTLDPASPHLLSEPAIVARLARAVLGTRTTVDWEGMAADHDRVRDAIERVIPGFADYNVRVRQDGGFHLPNAARERRFVTATGRAHFTTHALPRIELAPDELLLTTVRSHDQFNTTVYAPNDRYRGIRGGRRVLFMHVDDMRARGLAAGAAVDVTSTCEGRVRRARRFRVVPYDIPAGCVAAYFPETNVLVPVERTAERSNTPISKSVPVRVEPASAGAR
ncbi:oxidoreductase alpha (molybdopterin) subunit (plasmid) [Gemmatirosa kalamazoonensis]|uniref:Oxidoreductase alpha (Molybdopterin) subunit n=1 Tax=Gemmatirosa kalamazoonensis TaxID=861299 RepID=W0RQ44_9BACT|nr:FdhF/YdeP family oxidoreductase [Gemmatirosa kalamazoonensis]AHG93119.1 oxidoreductase alpha (molybdopterin) subunit [Gemmatirosa kalamazoonensis]